jgi:hypothetical protein
MSLNTFFWFLFDEGYCLGSASKVVCECEASADFGRGKCNIRGSS